MPVLGTWQTMECFWSLYLNPSSFRDILSLKFEARNLTFSITSCCTHFQRSAAQLLWRVAERISCLSKHKSILFYRAKQHSLGEDTENARNIVQTLPVKGEIYKWLFCHWSLKLLNVTFVFLRFYFHFSCNDWNHVIIQLGKLHVVLQTCYL